MVSKRSSRLIDVARSLRSTAGRRRSSAHNAGGEPASRSEDPRHVSLDGGTPSAPTKEVAFRTGNAIEMKSSETREVGVVSDDVVTDRGPTKEPDAVLIDVGTPVAYPSRKALGAALSSSIKNLTESVKSTGQSTKSGLAGLRGTTSGSTKKVHVSGNALPPCCRFEVTIDSPLGREAAKGGFAYARGWARFVWGTFFDIIVRIWRHPVFYIAIIGVFAGKFSSMASLAGSRNDDIRAAARPAVGVAMGLLEEGTEGGFPAPFTFDSSICLTGAEDGQARRLPNQYDFDKDPNQRAAIPLVYAFMHVAMFALAILPLSFAHAMWTSVSTIAPWLRAWWALPIDDLEYIHRLLGSVCLISLLIGALIWVATMIPACIDDIGNACAAFALGGGDGRSFDPFRTVLVLRLIVAPTWFTLLPLMFVTGHDWSAFMARARARTSFCGKLLVYVGDPVIWWIVITGVAIFMAFGTWLGAVLDYYITRTPIDAQHVFEKFERIGGGIGAAFGAVVGIGMATSPSLKTHWFEFCFWSHRFIAYFSMAVAIIARWDVFWPNAITWPILILDK